MRAALWVLLCLLLPAPAFAHAGLVADVARLTRELDNAPTAQLYLRRAGKLRLLERYDEALADIGRAQARGVSSRQAAEATGLVLAARGDAAAALEQFDRFFAGGGDSVEALKARAALLERLGRGDEAVLDLRRAMKRFPEPDVVLDLARLQETLGRPADATRTLEQGLETLGGAVTVRLALIALYRRTGQLSLALYHARAASAPLPVKTQWRLLAAEILLQQGHRQQARRELLVAVQDIDTALETRPNSLQQQARVRATALLEETRGRRPHQKESPP